MSDGTNVSVDVKKIMAERHAVYGDFDDVAMIAQALKGVIREGQSFGKLTRTQREGLEMILHKIARIVTGDPDYPDNWVDGAGYFMAVHDRLGRRPSVAS